MVGSMNIKGDSLSSLRFGRMKTFLMTNIIAVTGILVATSSDYTALLVFRALFGFGVKGGWMVGYVLCAFAFVAGGLVLLLPKTKGVPLPDTADDTECPNRRGIFLAHTPTGHFIRNACTSTYSCDYLISQSCGSRAMHKIIMGQELWLMFTTSECGKNVISVISTVA
ncbi:uncharacterized protein LOC127409866 isoform X1 [Myxocyprinus asiaticus]|uniref:uncharacterized protein LOC127409866 isoform X1 n=1 Tax=Myxocyprinus asiaticus TaxID=70543 RepID=UPI0022221501|nr:uncharacterized protein LOC127409866 isoform X1 [Myxocyprinus asiaticus]